MSREATARLLLSVAAAAGLGLSGSDARCSMAPIRTIAAGSRPRPCAQHCGSACGRYGTIAMFWSHSAGLIRALHTRFRRLFYECASKSLFKSANHPSRRRRCGPVHDGRKNHSSGC